jgi:hypothetical protein
MNQRRILIGAMIGVLAFNILTWVKNSTWTALEDQLILGRSALRFYNPYSEVNYLVYSFDEENKFRLANQPLEEQKETFLNIISDFSFRGAKSITLLVNNNNAYNIEDIDIEIATSELNNKFRIITTNEIEKRKKNSNNENLTLDRSKNNIKFFTVNKLLINKTEKFEFTNKNVLLISPRVELDEKEANLIINYLEDRWLHYIKIPSLIMLTLLVMAGILIAAFIYWARIIAFFIMVTGVLIFGQFIFSTINVHIETLPLLSALTGILILSNLFDLNLAAINHKQIFKSKEDQDLPKEQKKVSTIPTPFIQVVKEGDIASGSLKDMRSKFFLDQESNLEEIALEFQEKTVKSINTINEKLNELLESNQMIDRDKIRLSLIKHNFDQMIEEIDAILFNLVPFRFEGQQGLINLLELYANKLFLLSKSKLQLSIKTEFPIIKLELQQRVNSYRVIHRLIQLIIEANQDEIKYSGLNIGISILADKDAKMKFKISYEGMPIDSTNGGFKLKEVYRRLESLNSELNLGQNNSTSFKTKLTNHIEFKMSNPKGSVFLNK